MHSDNTIQKLKLAFLIVLTLIVGIVLFSIHNIRTINKQFSNTTNEIQHKISLTSNLRYFTRERALNLQLMILNEDAFVIDENWLAFNKNGARFAENRLALLKIINTEAEKQILENQGKITGQVIPFQLKVADLAISGDKKQAMSILVNNIVPLQKQIFETLDQLSSFHNELMSKAKISSTLAYEKVINFTWLSGVAVFLISLLTAFWITKRIRDYEQDMHELNVNLEHLVHQRTKELAASEFKQRNIIDNAIDGILSISRQGNVESFNLSAQKMFNYAEQIALSKTLEDLFFYQIASDSINNNEIVNLSQIAGKTTEMMATRNDGSTFPVLLGVSHIGHEDFDQNYICIVRDITEQKLVQQMKNEFIANISHELRTPVTSIHGSLGLLIGGVLGVLPDKAFDILKLANNNSERLIHIINNILDLQTLEVSNIDIGNTPSDLVILLQEICEKFNRQAENRKVKLIFQKTAESGNAYIDEKRIRQVLAHLLSNAIKFTPPGEAIIVGFDQIDEVNRITVTDYGRGISNEFKSKVFEIFTQEDSSSTREPGGTGLGLPIVKLILDKHNTKLKFISEKDKGTVFYFDLPIAEAVTARLNEQHSKSA